MKTSDQTTKSELKEVFALWENKKGETLYYTGKTAGDQPIRLVAFVNTTKKNPNQPDIQVYEQAEKGKEKLQIASLWENKAKKSGKIYFGGVDNEEKALVGFINENTQDGKYPSIRVYYSDRK